MERKQQYNYVVGKDYLEKMKKIYDSLINKWKRIYPNILTLLTKYKNIDDREKDIFISRFVNEHWNELKALMNESVHGQSIGQMQSTLIYDINKILGLSSYINIDTITWRSRTPILIRDKKYVDKPVEVLSDYAPGDFSPSHIHLRRGESVVKVFEYDPNGLTKGTVVNDIGFKKGYFPSYLIKDPRLNVGLIKNKPYELTHTPITDIDPFGINDRITVEPITTKNSITTILQKYTPYAASVAIGALVMWYIQQKNEMDGMAGGGADNNAINAYNELFKAGVKKPEVIKFIEEASHEQKLEIIEEINKNKKNVIIEDKDFKEFKLKDDDTVFGNMLEKMREGGKRKRSTKRSTKKNKKSNRKRRA